MAPELSGDVQAYEQERLKELAAQPNTTVYQTEFTDRHDAWKGDKLRGIVEGLAKRVAEADESMSDFQLRKQCLDDEQVLAFQRRHPHMYHMLTDRAFVKDTRFRQAIGAMLTLRERVDSGSLRDGDEADALAMSSIVAALQQP